MGQGEDVIEGMVTEEVLQPLGQGTLAPALRAPDAVAVPAPAAHLPAELEVDQLVARFDKVADAMARVMKDGVHYGTVPGVSKPTLLKPGSEVLCVLFQLAPRYTKADHYDASGHYSVDVLCSLWHIPTGALVAEGLGSCTTREKKYGYRQAQRACPACGAATIFKSKYAPKEGDYDGALPSHAPGWFCWGSKGGCGANYAADDVRITSQETGQVVNPDLPDQYNTVLKMGAKRALIAAVLNATGASALFTQDMEDNHVSGDGDVAADEVFKGGTVVHDRSQQPGQQQPAAEPVAAAAGTDLLNDDGQPLEKPQNILRQLLAVYPGWDWVSQARTASDAVHGPAPSIDARPVVARIDIAHRLYRLQKLLAVAAEAQGDFGFRPQDLQVCWFETFDGAVVVPVYTPSPEEAEAAARGAASVQALVDSGQLKPAADLIGAAYDAGAEPQPDEVAKGGGPHGGSAGLDPEDIPFGEDAAVAPAPE